MQSKGSVRGREEGGNEVAFWSDSYLAMAVMASSNFSMNLAA
tara:strand:- start:1665 stop:1790 length:126 start_codon:yes stop_codon:yes gene_type:complete